METLLLFYKLTNLVRSFDHCDCPTQLSHETKFEKCSVFFFRCLSFRFSIKKTESKFITDFNTETQNLKIFHLFSRTIDYSRNYVGPDARSPDNSVMGTSQQQLQQSQQQLHQQLQQQLQQQQLLQQQQQQQTSLRGSSVTPTMQQRIKAFGVATPLTISSPVRR